MVFRTYVEKRQGLAPECEALLTDCRDFLGVQGPARRAYLEPL